VCLAEHKIRLKYGSVELIIGLIIFSELFSRKHTIQQRKAFSILFLVNPKGKYLPDIFNGSF